MKEAKILIKLIAVDSNHFVRCKCKIMHCLDSQTLSEYISTIVLDDHEKHTRSLEVMIGVGNFASASNFDTQTLQGVGTFASASSFDSQTLQFVTMNEVKNIYHTVCNFILFTW